MSLLLEALKKAELAKQGKKSADDEAPASAIPVEPPPERRSGAQPVITRRQLPDISQPLEILSEDLPSASAKRAEAEPVAAAPIAMAPMESAPIEVAPIALAPPAPAHHAARREEPEIEPQMNAPDAGKTSTGSVGAVERDAARQLFEAKEVEYNPRRNFYITVGVLLAAGAGYGGYVWWQLQPRTAYSAAALQNAAKGAPVPSVSQAPAPQPPAEGAGATAATPVAAPGAPPAAIKPAPPLAPAAPAETQAARPAGPVIARSAAAPGAVARPSQEPAARPPSEALARAEQPPITVTPPVLAVDPQVERAFDSYQRGDLDGARDAYQQVLRRDPLNRDALLGLAAIDLRSRRFDTAESRYKKLLELDPRDVNAQAGLIALRGQIDPVLSESRLKNLIADNPDATPLHFALGNQYALQARWAEAQAAYFKAYSGDPENADFAFNLAVSLDQMRQKALALQYYQRAIALSADRPVGFAPAQVHIRVQELQRQ